MSELLAGRYTQVKRQPNKCARKRRMPSGMLQGMSTIGQRVRQLRKKRGYSQVELARLAGITQGSLSLIERNETEMPAGATLAGLCRALSTTPDFLVAGGGDPDSIEAAMQEHELVFLWRQLPEDARRLILENAHSVRRAFASSRVDK